MKRPLLPAPAPNQQGLMSAKGRLAARNLKRLIPRGRPTGSCGQ